MEPGSERLKEGMGQGVPEEQRQEGEQHSEGEASFALGGNHGQRTCAGFLCLSVLTANVYTSRQREGTKFWLIAGREGRAGGKANKRRNSRILSWGQQIESGLACRGVSRGRHELSNGNLSMEGALEGGGGVCYKERSAQF